MPANFSAIDNSFPSFTGKESPSAQIQMMLNYLHIMKQELQYILSNLTPENWNNEALEQMAQAVRSSLISTINSINEQVRSLNDKVDALGDVDFTDIQQRLDVLEQDADHKGSEIQCHGERILALEEAVSAGELRMDGHDAELEEQSAHIATAQADILSLDRAITALLNWLTGMGIASDGSSHTLGKQGQKLELVGEVYVNGVLLTGGSV